MSDAVVSQGTKLKVGDGATPEVFTAIAEVDNIDGPTDDTEEIEVTNHDSPSGTKEFVMGPTDLGTVSFSGNYMPVNATHDWLTGLQYLKKNKLKKNFQIVYPDVGATTRQFQAFVKTLTVSAPVAGVLKFSGTLRVTGSETWTA